MSIGRRRAEPATARSRRRARSAGRIVAHQHGRQAERQQRRSPARRAARATARRRSSERQPTSGSSSSGQQQDGRHRVSDQIVHASLQARPQSPARSTACRSTPAAPAPSPGRRTGPARSAAAASTAPTAGGSRPHEVHQAVDHVAVEPDRQPAQAASAATRSARHRSGSKKNLPYDRLVQADRAIASAGPARSTWRAVAQVQNTRPARCPTSATSVLGRGDVPMRAASPCAAPAIAAR